MTKAPPKVLSTVEALHAHLDLFPDDHDARGILADALDEAGEHELADGYRVLRRLRKTPLYRNGEFWAWWYCVSSPDEQSNILEGGWWTAWKREVGYDRECFSIDSRRECEDAAARAYRPEFEEGAS